MAEHKLAVSVSSNGSTSGSSRKTPSSQPSSSSELFSLALSPLTVTTEDTEMEESDVGDDQPVLKAPSFDLAAREGIVGRGFDGDDDGDDYGDNYGDDDDDDDDDGDYEEWDTDSELSDTEVLVNEDYDDVVPRSFDLDLSAPINPLSDDGSPGSDEQPPEPLLSKEEQSPPSARVFGSDSECLHPSFL